MIAVGGVPSGDPAHDVVIGIGHDRDAGRVVARVDSLDHEIAVVRQLYGDRGAQTVDADLAIVEPCTVIGAEAVPLRFFNELIIELEPVYWPSSRQSVEPGFATGQKLAT